MWGWQAEMNRLRDAVAAKEKEYAALEVCLSCVRRGAVCLQLGTKGDVCVEMSAVVG